VVEEKPDTLHKVETDMDVNQPEASTSQARPIMVDIPNPEVLPQGPRQRVLPSGPRNYVKTPTMSQSPQPSPVVPLTPSFEADIPMPSPTVRTAAQADTLNAFVPPNEWKHHYEKRNVAGKETKELVLSKPKATFTHDLDIELVRLRTVRARLAGEFSTISSKERRLQHELTLSTLDLSMMEQRHAIASAQLDKARAGVLGIDYVHSPAKES